MGWLRNVLDVFHGSPRKVSNMKTMQCKDIWNFTNSSHFPNILYPIWIFATVSILQYFVSNEKKMPLPCLRHFQYHTEKRKIDMRAMLMGGIGIEFVERIIWLWTDFLKPGGLEGTTWQKLNKTLKHERKFLFHAKKDQFLGSTTNQCWLFGTKHANQSQMPD